MIQCILALAYWLTPASFGQSSSYLGDTGWPPLASTFSDVDVALRDAEDTRVVMAQIYVQIIDHVIQNIA
jgi:predicted Zn-dependent protease